jgi:uncharacterized membrane protein YeaQ/YmgE (transglycosylase-associated protein family)
MGRSVIGLCGGFGMLVGGYVPALWGAGTFSLMSFVFSIAGAIIGIWAGVRIQDL